MFAGWTNPKTQVLYTQVEQNQSKESQQVQNMGESSFLTGFMEPQNQNQSVPKLEDFLGDSSSSMMRYSDSQTDTQDSSTLTHIYDQGSAYYSDQQDLKAIAGFQAFSTNSGSEVDDSASIAKTQATCGEFVAHSIESSGNELTFSSGATGTLSLGVTQCSDQKAIAPADTDSSKKIADTFGQRTSIYRGVTRYYFISDCFIFL